MRTIVLATQKGGSGKSTLAIGVAVAAMGDGHRVAMIETDQQGTVSYWGQRRTFREPHIERVGNSAGIEQTMLVLERNRYTWAVIDTPATNNALSAAAIRAADLCLIPARPSQADIEAAAPTVCIARKLGKPFAFVLNQASPRGYRQSEAAAALNAAGKLALPYIVQRNDHQNALCAGFGVTEFAPEGKAALEILALWRWIWQGAWMNQNKPSTTRPAAPRDQPPFCLMQYELQTRDHRTKTPPAPAGNRSLNLQTR